MISFTASVPPPDVALEQPLTQHDRPPPAVERLHNHHRLRDGRHGRLRRRFDEVRRVSEVRWCCGKLRRRCGGLRRRHGGQQLLRHAGQRRVQAVRLVVEVDRRGPACRPASSDDQAGGGSPHPSDEASAPCCRRPPPSPRPRYPSGRSPVGPGSRNAAPSGPAPLDTAPPPASACPGPGRGPHSGSPACAQSRACRWEA